MLASYILIVLVFLIKKLKILLSDHFVFTLSDVTFKTTVEFEIDDYWILM